MCFFLCKICWSSVCYKVKLLESSLFMIFHKSLAFIIGQVQRKHFNEARLCSVKICRHIQENRHWTGRFSVKWCYNGKLALFMWCNDSLFSHFKSYSHFDSRHIDISQFRKPWNLRNITVKMCISYERELDHLMGESIEFDANLNQ